MYDTATSVADPHPLDADPHPACHSNADPDPTFQSDEGPCGLGTSDFDEIS